MGTNEISVICDHAFHNKGSDAKLTFLHFCVFSFLEQEPVIKINLSEIKRLVKKRFLLRQVVS